MATVNLIPDSEGSIQQWNSTLFSHWTEVDDPVGAPDEDATFVYVSLHALTEEFNHATSGLLTGATISNVRLVARMRYFPLGFPSSAAVNLGVKIGVVRYAQPISVPITTGYRDYLADWVNNPAPPGNPWTKADIDNLQSSLMSVAPSLAQIRCTQIYFIVTYTPAVVGAVAGKGLISWTP